MRRLHIRKELGTCRFPAVVLPGVIGHNQCQIPWERDGLQHCQSDAFFQESNADITIAGLGVRWAQVCCKRDKCPYGPSSQSLPLEAAGIGSVEDKRGLWFNWNRLKAATPT